MEEILQFSFLGNTLFAYCIAIGGILVTWIVVRLIRKQVINFLKKLTARSSTNLDDLVIEIAERFVIPYVYLLVNYHILTQLQLLPVVERIAAAAFYVISTYFLVRLINFVIHSVVVGYMERKNEPPERIKQVTGMLLVVKAVTWGMGLVMLADNLGYDVTTIIAGLGVGGIAIALAAQNILGDLFSYFVIFFDKPFEIGDFIIVDGNFGVVEKIGIKTSHVRSPDGQQLVMPNAEMVKSVIHNYKRLQRRRVIFSIGVVYQTSPAKLRQVRDIIQQIVTPYEEVTFDRTHLKSFGDFSVNFEIVYYIESADYAIFMEMHHNISLEIFEQFEKHGIEFAFPTQTLYVNQQGGDAATNGEKQYNNHQLTTAG